MNRAEAMAAEGGARVGPRFATGGSRSRRGRLPGVFCQGTKYRAGALGMGDKTRKARRGRSRAGGRGAGLMRGALLRPSTIRRGLTARFREFLCGFRPCW
jgi:hypothetical protein